jgi:hypothetical protein
MSPEQIKVERVVITDWLRKVCLREMKHLRPTITKRQYRKILARVNTAFPKETL